MQRDIPEEVVALVERLLEAGCDMWAIRNGYVMNEPTHEPQASATEKVLEEFGPRAHLREDIAAYLRKLGRSFDGEML